MTLLAAGMTNRPAQETSKAEFEGCRKMETSVHKLPENAQNRNRASSTPENNFMT